MYGWILGKRDDIMLARLMGKTGVVIDQLVSQNVEVLMERVVELIGAHEFVDLLLPWVIAAVDRKVPLAAGVQSSIMNCLSYLLGLESSGEYRLDELQISEVNRAYNILKASLAASYNGQ